MLRSIDRHIALLQRTKRQFYVHKDTIWLEYNRMIQPYGAVSERYSLSQQDVRLLFTKLAGHLVRWTDGFGENKNPHWYAIICSEFQSLETLKSKFKSQIGRGVSTCEVRRIRGDFLAAYGYPIFMSAFERYRNAQEPSFSEPEFRDGILKTVDFDDLVHHWGVFLEEKLIGYSTNYVFDTTEVNYATAKFHPDYLKYRSSDSLFYQMNKYYLQGKKCQYVNDGFRTMLHRTSVQDYLKKTFGFKEAHTNLYVNYRPVISLLMTLSYPLKSVIGGRNSKLRALYELEEISRLSTYRSDKRDSGSAGAAAAAIATGASPSGSRTNPT